MNTIIASILKSKLQGIAFVDRIAGLVRVAEITNPTEIEGAFEVKKIPISSDVDFEQCFNDGCFKDLVPNSNNKGIIYFEDLGCAPNGMQGAYYKYSSKIRLVCWINNRLIQGDNCSSISHLLINQIRRLLEIGPFNQDNISKINVMAYNIHGNDEKLFANYTYPSESIKFLMHPYEAFGIDFKVDFSIGQSCNPDLVIEAYDCNPEE